MEQCSECEYFYPLDLKLGRYVCVLEGGCQIRSSVFTMSSGQMLLCTEWGINKLSEYSKKRYMYMKNGEQDGKYGGFYKAI